MKVTFLKISLIISIVISTIIFAVWSGLEFHDYTDSVIYSDNNFICAMQYVRTGIWGLSVATSPAWIMGIIVTSVKTLFPNIKQ